MAAEPWLLEQQHRMRLDRTLLLRPRCCDCGQHITSEQCLIVEEGLLCRDCVRLRMVDTDSIA